MSIAIAIFVFLTAAVLCDTGLKIYKRHMAHKAEALAARTQALHREAEINVARMERLEQRVRVLERIVTDKGLNLSEEIERLRNTPLN